MCIAVLTAGGNVCVKELEVIAHAIACRVAVGGASRIACRVKWPLDGTSKHVQWPFVRSRDSMSSSEPYLITQINLKPILTAYDFLFRAFQIDNE